MVYHPTRNELMLLFYGSSIDYVMLSHWDPIGSKLYYQKVVTIGLGMGNPREGFTARQRLEFLLLIGLDRGFVHVLIKVDDYSSDFDSFSFINF